MQIFISYKRQDQEFARTVRNNLQSWGHNVWLDIFDIKPSSDWDESIHQGLRAADVVVGVLTPESVASDNVLDEWGYALATGKRLYLLWLKDVAEPDMPPRYVRIQRIDFRSNIKKGFQLLERALTPLNIAEISASIKPAPSITPEIFISYSHHDNEYVQSLGKVLGEKGFNPWIDQRINAGDRWFQTIIKAIRECSAFIVIMTPEAEKSEWVESEILIAKKYKKPIFPLLLEGREFDLLITTQYIDVRGGNIPPSKFFSNLEGLAKLQPPSIDS